jgi:hydroxymethylpyrimidine pyrophosphatase-like HAD family hydrolase
VRSPLTEPVADGGISLVVTDLDGTLWRTDGSVHPETARALSALAQRKVPLLVATGRRTRSTQVPLSRIGLAPPAVVMNGAVGVHLSTGERFHLAPFSAADARKVLGEFEACGLSPVVYVEGGDVEVWLSQQPSTHPEHVDALRPHAGIGDLHAAIETEIVVGFSVLGRPHGELVPAYESIGAVAETHLDRSFDWPGTAGLTVAPRGQSKWDGVVAFCRSAGLDPVRVLAMGDGPNDVELLEGAAIRLVPENASLAARELAHHLIGPPEQGGWAQVLDFV